MRGFLFALLFLFAATANSVFGADDEIVKSQSKTSYLEKINPNEADLSRIFSVDLRHDKNFLKAIDSSINFYSSILSTDELFSYGDEQYTPLQMLHSLIIFRKLVTVEQPYNDFLVELQKHFDVYTPKARNEYSKFTGYYTPEIAASQVKSKIFNYPLYLSKNKIKSSKPDFYVQARNDIRKMEMEGAAILSLEDGTALNLQYAGRKRAIDELAKRKTIKKVVKKNGKKETVLVRVKQAPKTKAVFYVTETKALGSLSTELVPGFSAAMDMSVTPVGSLIYVKSKERNETQLEENLAANAAQTEEKKNGYESFMLVHDIGGAIKGPGRVDIYCGEGKQAKSCTYNVSSKGVVYLLVAKKNALMNFVSLGVE